MHKKINYENGNLHTQLKNKDRIIENLKLQLKFEHLKNKVYEDIIKKNTSINIHDIIKKQDDEIHIFNFENCTIPLVVHDFVKTHKYDLKIKKRHVRTRKQSDLIIVEDDEKTETCKKKTYRTVKKYIETSDKDLDIKLKKDVERVDKEIVKIVYDNFDVSHKDIVDNIEKIFTSIENNRSYTANVEQIKKYRRKLLGKLNLIEYTDLVQNHINRLTDIFSGRKKTNKEIKRIIILSLTPLDMRLVFYHGYTNINIDIDEVQKFGLVLKMLVEHTKKFVPYNRTVFFNNIKNYSLSLFEISECIERCLVNRYGFQSVIYLQRPKSVTKTSKKDPYSFYILENFKEDKRFWKMECRLIDFTNDFINNILPYCINLFRKIYKDVFSDNIYRDNYMGKSQITEFDCEQLLQNIIQLSKPISLCKTIQDIIINKCTFSPTESDKFNLYADDKLQRFTHKNDTEENTYSVIKQIFDGISNDDITSVLDSR